MAHKMPQLLQVPIIDCLENLRSSWRIKSGGTCRMGWICDTNIHGSITCSMTMCLRVERLGRFYILVSLRLYLLGVVLFYFRLTLP